MMAEDMAGGEIIITISLQIPPLGSSLPHAHTLSMAAWLPLVEQSGP